MIRPQRNGSGLKGYLRSNSYSIPSKHAKEMAKPTNDRSSLISEASQLPIKTLKKPITNYAQLHKNKGFNDDKTQPVISITLQNGPDLKNKLMDLQGLNGAKTQNNFHQSNNKTHSLTRHIEGDGEFEGNIVIRMNKDIKPARRQQQIQQKMLPAKINNFMNHLDDGNSIISAFLKTNYKELPLTSVIKQKVEIKEVEKPMGAAEAKLKNLMNPTSNPIPISIQKKSAGNEMKIKPERVTFQQKIEEQIPDDIAQEIEEDYLKEEFESIRESINGSGSNSNSQIKESIRIDNSIKESIKSMKESYGKSKFNNSGNGDKPSESNNIIEESIEVYEDDFQDQQSRHQTQRQQKLHSESSISKSFRKKRSPNLDISMKKSRDFQESMSIAKENKSAFDKLKLEVKEIMGKSKRTSDNWHKRESGSYSTESINTLYNKFKHELGRFMEKGRLQEKAKKLVSFLPQSYSQKATEEMMKRVLETINDFKQTNVDLGPKNTQNNYLDKIQQMMDNQQRRIRYDLQRNLKQKDDQIEMLLKKIQTMGQTKTDQRGKILDVLRKTNPLENYGQQPHQFEDYKFEDYSEQYSEVSWDSQINLWDNIPEEEKRSIFEKNSDQVMNHLVGLMMKEIKDEAIERSVDISFEFPAEIEAQVKNSKKTHDEQVPAKPNKSYLNDLSIISEERKSERSLSKSSKPSSEECEPRQRDILPNKAVYQKVSKAISKYQRKIKSKANKIFKLVYDALKSPDSNAMRVVTQTRILEQSQIDTKQLEYVRAYEQHIITQTVGFLNTHTGDYKRLQPMFKDRFDHILQLSKKDYLQSVQFAIASKKKDEIGKNFADNFNNYTYKRLEGEEPFKETLSQFQDKAEVNKTKKKIEEHILSILVEEAAREIRLRKK